MSSTLWFEGISRAVIKSEKWNCVISIAVGLLDFFVMVMGVEGEDDRIFQVE